MKKKKNKEEQGGEQDGWGVWLSGVDVCGCFCGGGGGGGVLLCGLKLNSFSFLDIHSPIHSFMHSSITVKACGYLEFQFFLTIWQLNDLIHCAVRSFIHSFIHLFIHSFIHSLIHAFIHSFIVQACGYPEL